MACAPSARQPLKVVAAERAEARRQLRAAAVAQLFGMQLDRNAQRFRRGEHTFASARREGDAFAKGVDRIDQAFGVQHGQHLSTAST
jgi:hypothetical protein